jgi:hypothetical protein
MLEVSLTEPDELDVVGAADPDPEPLLLQAAKSRAPTTTSPKAPPLRHLRRDGCTAQTAWLVGLKASGVPAALCAPGYLPNT